jgi:hypothetical protein
MRKGLLVNPLTDNIDAGVQCVKGHVRIQRAGAAEVRSRMGVKARWTSANAQRRRDEP